MLMLSTLSPGGKLQWISADNPKYLGPDDISNPFIEKSDIVNHKRKIADIDNQRDNVQKLYKNQTTWAQHEVIKKDQRDKYFE